jgi:hypothetical protein
MVKISAIKGVPAPRVIWVALVVISFVAAQVVLAVGATYGLCHQKATTTNSLHNCGHERHDADQGNHGGGCCCGDSAACRCELNQGTNTERQDLPAAIAENWTSPTKVDPGAVSAHAVTVPDLTVNNPRERWFDARAPSESMPLSTVKLLC